MVAVLTPKQLEAGKILAGPAPNIMLRGGSRSGKTFVLVRALLIRAMKAPGSRHAIFRLRRNQVRSTIWQDTLPKVLRLCFPGLTIPGSAREPRKDRAGRAGRRALREGQGQSRGYLPRARGPVGEHDAGWVCR